jgi:hypothetical protein
VEQWLTAFECFLNHCLPELLELLSKRGPQHKVPRFWEWSRWKKAFRNGYFLDSKGERCGHSLS